MSGEARHFSAGRFIIALALAVIAVLAVPGCGSSEKASKAVRFGILRNDLHQLAYYVAREKGYFSDEGLDVREGGAFNAGPEEMSAFAAGELDMGLVGTAPIVTFASQKMADVKIVAQANTEGSAILVRAGLEGEDMASFRGRTIAVPGFSTVQDFLLRLALEKAKLADTDVNIIVLKPPETLAAFSSSQIDGAVSWEPYPSMAVTQNKARIMLTSHQIWADHPCCMLIVSSEFLRENPDTVRKVVAAHVKATDFINKNKLEATDMAHLFTGQDKTVCTSAMKNIKFDDSPDPKQILRYVDFIKTAGVVKVDDTAAFVNGLMDLGFLPEEKSK